MTLYCHTVENLPYSQMARLGPGAWKTHYFESDPKSGAEVERYTYRWPDFEINFYLKRQPDIAAHLQGVIDFAARKARARGSVLDHAFVRRVQATRLMIGYEAGPDYQEPSRFKRLEEMLVSLRQNTLSLFLWDGGIYDEFGQLLIS